MNIKAFSGKEIQHFLTLLNGFEQKGVTDIRFVRERINRRWTEIQAEARLRKRAVPVAKVVCPGCDRIMRPVVNNEGLRIYGCKSCRYSGVMA